MVPGRRIPKGFRPNPLALEGVGGTGSRLPHTNKGKLKSSTSKALFETTKRKFRNNPVL